jgi:hypothetical protein
LGGRLHLGCGTGNLCNDTADIAFEAFNYLHQNLAALFSRFTLGFTLARLGEFSLGEFDILGLVSDQKLRRV